MKKIHLSLDDRNRVTLTKVSKHLAKHFYAYEKKGVIILEPIIELPDESTWLVKPKKKDLIALIKKKL